MTRAARNKSVCVASGSVRVAARVMSWSEAADRIFPNNAHNSCISGASTEIPVISCFSLFEMQENLLVFLRKGSLVRVSL